MNLNPNSMLVLQVLASYKSEWTFSLSGEISQDTIKVSVKKRKVRFTLLINLSPNLKNNTELKNKKKLAYLNYQNKDKLPPLLQKVFLVSRLGNLTSHGFPTRTTSPKLNSEVCKLKK